jgi:hypothetical protein
VDTFRDDVLPSFRHNATVTQTNVSRKVASAVSDTVKAYGQRLRIASEEQNGIRMEKGEVHVTHFMDVKNTNHSKEKTYSSNNSEYAQGIKR